MFLNIFENSLNIFRLLKYMCTGTRYSPPVTKIPHISTCVTEQTTNLNVPISNIANWSQQDVKM